MEWPMSASSAPQTVPLLVLAVTELFVRVSMLHGGVVDAGRRVTDYIACRPLERILFPKFGMRLLQRSRRKKYDLLNGTAFLWNSCVRSQKNGVWTEQWNETLLQHIHTCIMNQHDSLFFALFLYHASTCFGLICSPSSGGKGKGHPITGNQGPRGEVEV
jgi:hypothetical protein